MQDLIFLTNKLIRVKIPSPTGVGTSNVIANTGKGIIIVVFLLLRIVLLEVEQLCSKVLEAAANVTI